MRRRNEGYIMKRFIAAAAAAVMLISAAGCGETNTTENDASNTSSVATDSDLAYIRDNGVMKIGYTIMAPLNYTNDENELVGFETEFATAVCEKLGVKPEFQLIDWNSKEMELESKSIDCIWNGLTITPERQESMSITNPYMENRQVLIVKNDNVDKYTDSVDGANVVAESASAGDDLAQADEFFANASYTSVQSQATALMDVASGTADVAVIDYIMALGSVGEGTDFADLTIIDKGFESEEYGAAFRKGSDVTAEVNTAMDELRADGTLQQLAEKYNIDELLITE